HRRREVDPEHVVAGVEKAPGEDAGAAPDVDDEPGADAVPRQEPQRFPPRALGEVREARVVDERQVLAVRARAHGIATSFRAARIRARRVTKAASTWIPSPASRSEAISAGVRRPSIRLTASNS